MTAKSPDAHIACCRALIARARSAGTAVSHDIMLGVMIAPSV
jgi:hypothetical protein